MKCRCGKDADKIASGYYDCNIEVFRCAYCLGVTVYDDTETPCFFFFHGNHNDPIRVPIKRGRGFMNPDWDAVQKT
jgi:hypothetical protein